jgi:uncharacterized protein (DUF1501 family)
MKRRQFIQAGSLATVSWMVPQFLKAFESNGMVAVPPGNKVAVVLQMSGGNDGLNTVVPIGNDIYHRSRPGLGIEKNKALLLTDDAALHPALTAFKNLYDDGSLGILNSVGYPTPDRSHFRSMDIWQTGSDSSAYLTTGWLGRYLDEQCAVCGMPTQALEIDDILSLALKGSSEKGIAFKNPRRLYNTGNENYFRQLAAQHHASEHEKPVDYLYKTMAATLSSADYIFEQSRLHPTKANYPATDLGNNLKTIASLIFSDINTKVYYVSIGSFDTHVNQQNTQQRLFKQMNDAISAFVADLKNNNRFNDVLLFTFSEFGRRVAQNASGGTDHGTANSMFFISGGLQQEGLINPLPNLADLDAGDLKYQVDFKQVYATILKKWLQADDRSVLKKRYDYLNFI